MLSVEELSVRALQAAEQEIDDASAKYEIDDTARAELLSLLAELLRAARKDPPGALVPPSTLAVRVIVDAEMYAAENGLLFRQSQLANDILQRHIEAAFAAIHGPPTRRG